MSIIKVGDQAPFFKGYNQNKQHISLDQFEGKKIVLYFYPRNHTFFCTKQACHLRDEFTNLKALNYVIIGVSTDTIHSHYSFMEKYSLPFHLISDTERIIHQCYGTWIEKKMFGKKYWGTARKTFVIDEKKTILKVIEKVDAKNHTKQILSA